MNMKIDRQDDDSKYFFFKMKDPYKLILVQELTIKLKHLLIHTKTMQR